MYTAANGISDSSWHLAVHVLLGATLSMRCGCVCRYTTITPQQGSLPGRSPGALKGMQALQVQPQSPSPQTRFPTQAGQKLHVVTVASITIMRQKRYMPFSLAKQQITTDCHILVFKCTFICMQQNGRQVFIISKPVLALLCVCKTH